MSRKPNDRKNRKSCPHGQMLPSGRRRTVAGPSELNHWILCMDRFPLMLEVEAKSEHTLPV